MKITENKLEKMGACQKSINWFISCNTTDPIELMKIAQKSNNLKTMRYAIWGFTHVIDKKNRIRFAVYCAEKVLHLFEKEYPDDKRPRQAIQAAKRYMKNMTEENQLAAAYATAYAAAADAADAAASDAAYAAAASDAAYASVASKKELYILFIKYAIKILKEDVL